MGARPPAAMDFVFPPVSSVEVENDNHRSTTPDRNQLLLFSFLPLALIMATPSLLDSYSARDLGAHHGAVR